MGNQEKCKKRRSAGEELKDSELRVLKPRELEALKGGAQPTVPSGHLDELARLFRGLESKH